MRQILPVAVLAAAALAVAACDKPARPDSAYINSGQSATPAMPATDADARSTAREQEPAAVTSSPATSDTASPNTAAPSK
jgi:hypothetical protein